MHNAVAFANNDVITIAWSLGSRPTGCLGFALYRIDPTGIETVLPSHAVWPGDTIKPGQTTADYPIQKFYWKDPYARLEAEKTGNRTFHYKIVPLHGAPGALQPMPDQPVLVTNEATVAPAVSQGLTATFNRGLISTQRVSRAMTGHLAPVSLIAEVSKPDSRLRASLSGDMVETLTGFLARTAAGGDIYAALYELGDDELIAQLTGLGHRLHLVLSNAIKTDPDTNQKTDSNAGARATLKATDGEQYDRVLGANQIGHNKFLVYVDPAGTPTAVLAGSTNWTPTGLCTQTNNTLVIDNPDLAARYLSYWHHLATDTNDAAANPKALQAAPLRTFDATGATLADAVPGATVQSWFSPNTPKLRGRPAGEARPPDMAALIERINAAEQAILFLAFYPGSPSIANWTADALRANPDLFVRGCVTNRSAAAGFYTELRGSQPPPTPPGTPRPRDYRVLAAEALDTAVIPPGWQKELLNAGFAVVHDKIVVIDPFSDNCIVATGSHNLGHKASYNNDENLLIIHGNRALAAAYATHVLDVYDHFAWRYRVNHWPDDGDPTLENDPETWLNRYFDTHGNIKTAQLKFWMHATT